MPRKRNILKVPAPEEKPEVFNYVLKRAEEEGREFITFKIGPKQGSALKFPISHLISKGILDRQQYQAAKNYSHLAAIATLSHHSRPSYDGTARSTSIKTDFMSQSQLDAAKKLEVIRREIMARTEKVIYLDLIEILFETQASIKHASSSLRILERDIEEMVVKICDILLEMK